MRRISIDTLGMKGAKDGAAFYPKRRRTPWYLSRPRLLTTLLCFLVLYTWLNFGGHAIVIPRDSWDYVRDGSVTDIMNATLGFQKLLVLNLPFRTDRRDAMTLSAATTNMQLEFVDGVTGDSIKQSAYPPPQENIKLLPGIRGSWRTHMNALQRVVEQNLTTALIFEDDVDWDVRIRQNLQRFALASRFLSTNKEILSSSPRYKIENVENVETEETTFRMLSDNHTMAHLPSLPLASLYRKSHHPQHHSSSPYGDPSQWDVLWFGHCGAGFPRYSPLHKKTDVTTANVILTNPNDETVPAPRHLKAHPFQSILDPLAEAYPPHTRIYHRSTGGELCTVAYAVSQRGAQRLLHQFGVKGWNGIFDSELGRWCAGEDPDMGASASPSSKKKISDGRERICLASQPPIFAHHHPMDGESDIGGLGGGYATKFETKYLRYSVRMNLERIVMGRREKELVDQWPDEGGHAAR
ncbi:glycosyltransferase family 25 protein [Karstenula rhodostoma CBS 690.94]|uniref:Glycosyltransferase family 25 protein n=1 Tax=Karstenula rhodostoma CBS 690.94 TaxID=1392251 RepID=A0A9P4PPM0_9PLEO|nr:glycosyltransferase family 25 protein [Karstenula rhodostoma CBS 690.94]